LLLREIIGVSLSATFNVLLIAFQRDRLMWDEIYALTRYIPVIATMKR
jgi:hypothetical protein